MTQGIIRGQLSAGERQDDIMRLLQSSPFVSVTDLVNRFGVSDMTIRRDLRHLSQAGEVQVVHGGASLVHSTFRTADFAARAQLFSDAKQRIAVAAQRFVHADAIIAVDAGTTTFATVAALPSTFSGTIITHSVPVLQHMLSHPQVRVLGLGGELVAESQAMVGPRTVEGLSDLRADIFFLGAAAIAAEGVYVATDIERPIKRAFMAAASQVVLLADHGKLTSSAAVRLGGFSQIDAAITDKNPPKSVIAALKEAGTELIIAP